MTAHPLRLRLARRRKRTPRVLLQRRLRERRKAEAARLAGAVLPEVARLAVAALLATFGIAPPGRSSGSEKRACKDGR